jgi:hypothetical protein
MSIELDRPGGGVAAFMLSVGTLVALEKNGTLANDELADIVEESLARLKAIDAETSVRSQAAWEPLSISSSNFAPVSLAIGAGDSSII